MEKNEEQPLNPAQQPPQQHDNQDDDPRVCKWNFGGFIFLMLVEPVLAKKIATPVQ